MRQKGGRLALRIVHAEHPSIRPGNFLVAIPPEHAFLDPNVDWLRITRFDSGARAESIASRMALSQAFRDIGEVPGRHLSASLSHSHEIGAAAVWAQDAAENLRSVGVDVEWASRPVSDRIVRRIRNADDDLADLPAIGTWAAKEAVFKVLLVDRFSEIRLDLKRESEGTWRGNAHAKGHATNLAVAIQSGLLLACAVGRPPTPGGFGLSANESSPRPV